MAAPERARNGAHPRADRSGRGGRPWRRLRERILQRDRYLCQPCERAGRITEAAEVDHLKPLAAGGTDDERNLQSICVGCHRAKSLAEQPALAASTLPLWLPEPQVPVALVAGPPGAGKSALVRQSAAPTDMVLDLDEIAAELSGLPPYHAGREWLPVSLRTRNARLASLAGATPRYTAAWLIVGAPTATERRTWRGLLGPDSTTTVLAVDPETAAARTSGRPEPEGTTWRALIDRWWARYSTGYGESVQT